MMDIRRSCLKLESTFFTAETTIVTASAILAQTSSGPEQLRNSRRQLLRKIYFQCQSNSAFMGSIVMLSPIREDTLDFHLKRLRWLRYPIAFALLANITCVLHAVSRPVDSTVPATDIVVQVNDSEQAPTPSGAAPATVASLEQPIEVDTPDAPKLDVISVEDAYSKLFPEPATAEPSSVKVKPVEDVAADSSSPADSVSGDLLSSLRQLGKTWTDKAQQPSREDAVSIRPACTACSRTWRTSARSVTGFQRVAT